MSRRVAQLRRCRARWSDSPAQWQLDGDEDGGHAAKAPKVRAVHPALCALLLASDAPALLQHRRKKDRNAPKRPKNAYLVFLDRHREKKHEANPTAAMKARSCS